VLVRGPARRAAILQCEVEAVDGESRAVVGVAADERRRVVREERPRVLDGGKVDERIGEPAAARDDARRPRPKRRDRSFEGGVRGVRAEAADDDRRRLGRRGDGGRVRVRHSS